MFQDERTDARLLLMLSLLSPFTDGENLFIIYCSLNMPTDAKLFH